MTTTTTDFYALLGVTPDATPAQIRSAYRKLAKQCHPDVNNSSDAADRFREITEAYDTLTDPDRHAATTGSTAPGAPPSAETTSGPGTPGPATAHTPETGPPAATAPRPPAAS